MYYPIHLNISNLKIVVVGGGEIAYRRSQFFVEAGKPFTVVAKSFLPEFLELKAKDVNFIQEAYEDKHIASANLVIAATSDSELNARIGRICAELGKLVNVVSDQSLSSFIVPAVIKRGDLLLSASTNGKNPAFAKQIKEELESIYGPEYGERLAKSERVEKNEKNVIKKEINELPLFSTLKQDTKEKLANILKVKSYKKGELLFFERDLTQEIFISLTGKFSLYKLNDKLNKRIIFLFGPGVLLNDHLNLDLTSAITCEAFEDGEVLIGCKKEFVKVMASDFEFAQIILEQFSSKLRRTYRQLKNAPSNISVEKKLASKLYALSRDYGVKKEDGILIDFPLTVTHLADMLGLQRETTSRTLSKLVKEGLIRQEKKRIFIYNINAIVCYFRDHPAGFICKRCELDKVNCFFKERK